MTDNEIAEGLRLEAAAADRRRRKAELWDQVVDLANQEHMHKTGLLSTYVYNLVNENTP